MGPVDERHNSIVKGEGLSITIDTNLTETDFLDVSLNLKNGSYSPYRKPDNYPSYINVNSNHPPSIIKELPNMVNKRLRELSSSKNEFESAKGIYNSALKNSGYTQNLAYEKEHNTSQSKQRKRKSSGSIRLLTRASKLELAKSSSA